MSKQTISFRTEKSKKIILDDLAASLNQDRSAILNKAIDILINVYDWQLQHIEKSLQQAENQEFIEESKWRQAFNKNRK